MSSAEAVSSADDGGNSKGGFFGRLKSAIPPKEERQKMVPLALMFFCILFNYTILRDTKDVLMVTAPKSGAEVIPFIKTYVNLPAAIVRSSTFFSRRVIYSFLLYSTLLLYRLTLNLFYKSTGLYRHVCQND